MTQITDLTVLKSDGSTNVVYNVLTPSAGDKMPARWAATAMSSIPAHRATFWSSSRDNGQRTGRRHNFSMTYPVVVEENSVPVLKGTVPIECSVFISSELDSAQTKEAFYQFGNLMVTSLIRSQMEQGYAPV